MARARARARARKVKIKKLELLQVSSMHLRWASGELMCTKEIKLVKPLKCGIHLLPVETSLVVA